MQQGAMRRRQRNWPYSGQEPQARQIDHREWMLSKKVEGEPETQRQLRPGGPSPPDARPDRPAHELAVVRRGVA